MFDNYFNEAKQDYEKQKNQPKFHINIQEDPLFNKSVLVKNIKNVDSMSNDELYNFIKLNFNNILHSVFYEEDNIDYINQFQNIKFLDVFIRVLSEQVIYDDLRIKCNTICYEYISMKEKDITVGNKLMEMSDIVNAAYLPAVIGLGIPKNIAQVLVVSRFSNVNLNVVIKRLDFIIITQSRELMTYRMIKDLLLVLFRNPAIDFVRIFPYFMYDVLPSQGTYPWITESAEEINSLLELAMLEIINDLDYNSIRNIILNYAEGDSIIGQYKPKRFSIDKLSDDYHRINDVIYNLKYNEGLSI